jgi:ABC-2 type transport system permease protein
MLGLGLNHTVSFQPAQGEGLGYLAFFFPGTVVLMVLFTAIFATISIIEDRREGFLQAVLVSPAPRWAIVLGKVLGGSAIAWVQGLVMLILGAWLVGFPGWLGFFSALGVLGCIAAGLTGLGVAMAWPMDSTAGFHALMNLLLMPMWLLCGAIFPAATAAGPVKWLMYANPLTYGQWAFATLWTDGRVPALGVPFGVALLVCVAFAMGMVTLATAVASKNR